VRALTSLDHAIVRAWDPRVVSDRSRAKTAPVLDGLTCPSGKDGREKAGEEEESEEEREREREARHKTGRDIRIHRGRLRGKVEGPAGLDRRLSLTSRCIISPCSAGVSRSPAMQGVVLLFVNADRFVGKGTARIRALRAADLSRRRPALRYVTLARSCDSHAIPANGIFPASRSIETSPPRRALVDTLCGPAVGFWDYQGASSSLFLRS